MQKRFFFLFAIMLVLATGLKAQVTTSSLSGRVTLQETNETVIGATVLAVHEPSGTRYTAVSNVDGRFHIQGMRNGGPYKVTVSYIGYQTKTLGGIILQLGETYNLDVWLTEDANELSEVIISGKASKFNIEKTGATTNISNSQILEMPTISRSITDITRISPYANGMSFAGGDGRSTNFKLDGANFNNNFGLSSSLPGGGTPISMDAIDEVQVVVAPFDVRQTNFIGGGINAVTKSGTNTFKGTAYIYYNNENMHGNRVDNTTLADPGRQRQTTYGFTLGGPIIKNKLFFFANYEYTFSPTVVNLWQPSENGVADPTNYISRTTKADMEKVRQFMKNTYGYDTGSYTDFPADETNKKFLVRLDWNITDNHHLAVRYNHTLNQGWNNTNGNSCDTGFRLNGMNRLSQYSMAFANSMYSMDNKISTVSVDLNSRFGNNISNQLLVTYSDIEDIRGSNSSKFPFIDIMNGYSTAADGTVTQTLEPYMSLGYELFTWNNGVKNKVTTVNDNFTYYLGAHKLTAGISYEHQLANNAYMRNGTGYYRYRSLDDFLSGAAPESVALTYGYDGEKSPAAQVTFNQLGLYIQDEFNPTKNLKLTAGIRFDHLGFDEDDVMRNNKIYELDFGGRRVDTGKWPDGNIQISPRLGFSWDVFGDRSLKVRGGTGLFAGRIPLVFFTNMPTNSNMVQGSVTAVTRYSSGVVSSRDDRLDKFAGGIITDTEQMRELLGAPRTITPDDGAFQSAICGVDKDFKMPQVWKSSIAVDYQVPVSFPFTLTAEYTYVERLQDVRLENWNIKTPDDTWGHLAGADNRLVYPSDFRYYNNVNTACVLTNTTKGYGWTFNLTATAEPIRNLNLMAAYTHTVQKEVSGMPGSNAASAWQGLYTVNGPNLSGVQNSTYVIPDRVIASVSYKYNKEHFSLFYQGYSPSGYSYFVNGDLNNDGIAYDLMYIPRDDSEINFTNEADRVDFWNYIQQDDYLNNHRGEYAEAYSARAPFVHRFDFRYAHDFTVKVGSTRHLLQLSADVTNIGNMFNSKWGVAKTMSTNYSGQFLKVDKIVDGVPYYSMRKLSDGSKITQSWEYNHAYGQCWQLQIGVKYYFN